ncbi:hypothetical protein CSA37_01365 [Candidatus Fermentibacteria bacterium]|nr:MAG: hypothetical protein CSA37_01365 [Candidatus Fermentibacteria bacterium]
MSRQIPDLAVRKRIAAETENSVVVEASAGTGKTTLLTDRVCSIANSGIPLERLAVVTFTEAAAAELRIRIRENLLPEARKRLEQAWIHTIHSFASRILREYYHLCGTLPEFSNEASHFSNSEMEAAWDLFLACQEKSAMEPCAEALRSPGSSALLKIASRIERERWLESPKILGDPAEALKQLRSDWIARLEDLTELCTNKSDKKLVSIEKTLKCLKTSEDSIPLTNRGGSGRNWGGDETFNHVKERIAEIIRENRELPPAYRAMELLQPALVNLVFPFVNMIRTRWDSDPSRLAFDDLLYLAGKAVRESEPLRKTLYDSFDYVFIDEFQDTSLTQVNLFRDILGNAGLSRKLTVVGDPKQSIYGWRSADIETYKDTISELENKGALSETITVNFRSAVSVVNFVNSFGEALFQGASAGEAPFSSSYSPIDHAPSAKRGEGVHIHRLPEPNSENGAIHGIMALQAAKIAELITEPESTAILLRTRTHMDSILRELDLRGIPYRVEAGTDFDSRPEVKDFTFLLRYLLHPDDKISETRTLRSLFFGIDDRKITEWKLTEKPCSSIQKALELTEKLRAAARSLPADMLVRTIFSNTCLLETVKRSRYQAGRRLANMRFILEQAGKNRDPVMLLEILEGRSPVSADEPAAPPDSGSGAVTVSTIHRAKGLAWKHVITASPGTSFRSGSDPVLTDQRGKRLGLKLGKGFSADYYALKEREKNRQRAEFRRLMYVAVTRPKDRLDMFLLPSDSNSNPCGIISNALEQAEHFKDITVEYEEVEALNDSSFAIPSESPGSPFKEICNFSFPQKVTERETAMLLGTEVHRILELIDMENPESWLKDNYESMQKSLKFPEKTIELARNFFSAFSLNNAAVIGREFPLTASGRFYYIDLLLERNGELEAVDFKTDTGNPEERAEFYREHQQLYIRELEKATGRKVRAFLVFLHHEVVIEIEPERDFGL